MSGLILVTGATGFVGRAVRKRLRSCSTPVRWAHHEHPLSGPVAAHHEVVHLDMTDRASIRRAVAGCELVLHLANRVQGDRHSLWSVNAGGATMLANEAARGGARVVRLSTTSVYGTGPWRGEDIDSLAPAPRSLVSTTRSVGDEAVLGLNGVVVRPHLVYGPGDRWVTPGLACAVSHAGLVEGGQALHSTVHVDELARLLLDLGRSAWRPGVLLAAEPAPVSVKDLVARLLPSRDGDVKDGDLKETGGLDPRFDEASVAHFVSIMRTDHYLVQARRAVPTW